VLLGIGSTIAWGCGSSPSDVTPGPEGGAEEDATRAPVDAGAPIDAAGPEGASDDACVGDAGVDCTGMCGPVADPCTGKVTQCGGCSPVTGPDGGVVELRVCDLGTNTCIKPKATCADLGAECGTIKDSCGDYLDCPDTTPKGCPAGKECNPDTHKCQDCTAVTCADLGYECGFAWLGCGPDTQANLTDCGGCTPDSDGGARVCNSVFNVCEPKCVPKSAAEICAAARAKQGVECGYVSDGCGGIVDCDAVTGFGCKSGQSCGVRGIANRCDPYATPDECEAQDKTCGDIVSACTGKKIHCGDCASGQVCNANGVCGQPCTSKTCADFAQYECGTFDDGCGATITCGTCPSGVCEQSTHACCATKQCGVDYKNACGTGLPNGCGQTEACACPGGTTCTADGGAAPAPSAGTTGACCTPLGASYYTGQNECGTALPNGCGQNNVTANCPAGKECVDDTTGSPGPMPPPGKIGTCCTRTDSCTGIDAGSCPLVQDSCRPGAQYTCNKCQSGQSCVSHACCRPAPACPAGACNITEPPVDPGCGSTRTCACSGANVCWCTDHVCTAADGQGACTAPLTCGSAAYAGKCGTGLSNGVGGTINCGCPNGQSCSTSTPGQTGICQCNNGLGGPYTCQNVPGGPGQGGDACGTFNNGCGGTVTCSCPGGEACKTSVSPHICCAPATCPAPALGSTCGQVTNGCTTVSCSCPSGAGN
jgi:hypothetical protein